MEEGVEYLSLDRVKESEFVFIQGLKSTISQCRDRNGSQWKQFSVRIVFIRDRNIR
jgi:hypothetical protein